MVRINCLSGRGGTLPVTIKTDHDKKLTIFTVTGKPTFQEAMETFKEFYTGTPTRNVLWDFRKASLAFISAENAEVLLDFTKHHVKSRAGGKTAALVSNELDYGISRMIQISTELKGIPLKIEVFRSVEEVNQWLDEKE